MCSGHGDVEGTSRINNGIVNCWRGDGRLRNEDMTKDKDVYFNFSGCHRSHVVSCAVGGTVASFAPLNGYPFWPQFRVHIFQVQTTSRLPHTYTHTYTSKTFGRKLCSFAEFISVFLLFAVLCIDDVYIRCFIGKRDHLSMGWETTSGFHSLIHSLTAPRLISWP